MTSFYTSLGVVLLVIISLTVLSIYLDRRRYNKITCLLQERFGEIVKTEFRRDGRIFVYTGKKLFEVKLRRNKIVEEKMLIG
jgi:hypothetical protein